MKPIKLEKKFFTRSALEVGPELLGKIIVHKTEKELRFRITEIEIYYGEEDTACHAHKGRTSRTETLYQEGGTLYVYLCYGIHHLLNIVTGSYDHPEAVLIRGIDKNVGPGRVSKALKISKDLNNTIIPSENFYIEDDDFKPKYHKDKRIGIDYATPKYKNIKWRYIVDE